MMYSSMEMRTPSSKKRKKNDRGSWMPFAKSIPRLSPLTTIASRTLSLRKLSKS